MFIVYILFCIGIGWSHGEEAYEKGDGFISSWVTGFILSILAPLFLGKALTDYLLKK